MRAPRLLSLALRARLLLPAAAVATALLAASTPARAESAADKATARDLAVAGIKLYRAGNYKAALDKLKRAEALYNAPIHLLYIARCQVKLGKIVEGTETYRRLGRVQLAADAPEVFKQAQAAGAKELAAVAPTIPMIRVEVTPANVNNLVVVIDHDHLPAAIVGVDRPADPGKHTVRVEAPGFAPAEQTVVLKLGEKKPVKFTLKPAASGAGTGAAAGAGNAPPAGGAPAGANVEGSTGGSGSAASPPPAAPAKKPSVVGFLVGLRAGGLFSTGTAFNSSVANTTMGQFFGPGGGVELHGGIRLWKYFTPVLFGDLGGLYPVDHIYPPHVGLERKPPPTPKNPNPAAQTVGTTSKGSYRGGGIGVIVGTPRGHLGAFGEVDLAYDSMTRSTNVTTNPQCTLDATLSGVGLRLGGGAAIPLTSFLQLSPFAAVTIEKFSSQKLDSTCGNGITNYPIKQLGSSSVPSPATHATFFLGVGGDFMLGGDKPAK